MTTTDARHEPASLTAQRHILTIVDTWPALCSRVATGGAAGGEKVRGSRTPPLPISVAVVDVIAEIDSWAMFLARVLIDETDWTPPAGQRTDAILNDVARWRIGHFTEHPDEMLTLAFYDDAERLDKLVKRTAYPSGRRWLRVGVRCVEHTTTDLGERVPCRGHLSVLADPDAPYVVPDLICSRDREHRIDPTEWQRAWRRAGGDLEAVEEILRTRRASA